MTATAGAPDRMPGMTNTRNTLRALLRRNKSGNLGLVTLLLGATAYVSGACSGGSVDCDSTRTCAGTAAGASSGGAADDDESAHAGKSGRAGTSNGGAAGKAADSAQGGGAGAGERDPAVGGAPSSSSDGSAGHADDASGGGGQPTAGGATGSDTDEGGAAGDGGQSTGGDGNTVEPPPPPPPFCGEIPTAGCVPSAASSVFVNATASAGGNGAPGTPFQTITAALEAVAQGKATRVLVCSGTYAERVALTAEHHGASLLGGFSCSDWRYDPLAAAEIAPSGAGSALELQKVDGAKLSDLRFTARDATAAGASSIAAFVNESTNVALTRVSLRAGAGKDGAAGKLEPFTNWPTAEQLAGKPGLGQSMVFTTFVGGAANQVTCPDGNTSKGGRGGAHPYDQLAQPGEPVERGGTGGVSPAPARCDAIDDHDGCFCLQPDTTQGKRGPAGTDGGAAATAGSLSASSFVAFSGGNGSAGLPGGGGAGGDGAWITNYMSYQDGWFGGGGGGAGGCGGNGAKGGQGGGASIALAVRSSTVNVSASAFITASAGNGGAGIAGQAGQVGGAGGMPIEGATSHPCRGSAGGAGGKGGSSGGGAGGLSVGIVFTGTQPTVDAASTYELGQRGAAGPGGAASNAGAEGIAQQTLQVQPG